MFIHAGKLVQTCDGTTTDAGHGPVLDALEERRGQEYGRLPKTNLPTVGFRLLAAAAPVVVFVTRYDAALLAEQVDPAGGLASIGVGHVNSLPRLGLEHPCHWCRSRS